MSCHDESQKAAIVQPLGKQTPKILVEIEFMEKEVLSAATTGNSEEMKRLLTAWS